MNEDYNKIEINYDELRDLYELRKSAPNKDELKKINDEIAKINSKINVKRLKANAHKYGTMVKDFNDFRSKVNDLRLEGLYSGCVAIICVAPDGFVGASVSIQGNEQEFSHVDGFTQAASDLGVNLYGNDVYGLGVEITSLNGVAYQIFPGYVIAYLPSNLTQEQSLVATKLLTEFNKYDFSILQNGVSQDFQKIDVVQEILSQSVGETKTLSR